MTDFVKSVITFNQVVLGIGQKNIIDPKQSELEFIGKCVTEEAEEFTEAVKNGDFIGCVDALIDITYFAIGGLYRFGLSEKQIKEVFDVVHAANMSKVKGVIERRNTGASDAVKPEDWEGPEEKIARILGDVWQ